MVSYTLLDRTAIYLNMEILAEGCYFDVVGIQVTQKKTSICLQLSMNEFVLFTIVGEISRIGNGYTVSQK